MQRCHNGNAEPDRNSQFVLFFQSWVMLPALLQDVAKNAEICNRNFWQVTLWNSSQCDAATEIWPNWCAIWHSIWDQRKVNRAVPNLAIIGVTLAGRKTPKLPMSKNWHLAATKTITHHILTQSSLVIRDTVHRAKLTGPQQLKGYNPSWCLPCMKKGKEKRKLYTCY